MIDNQSKLSRKIFLLLSLGVGINLYAAPSEKSEKKSLPDKKSPVVIDKIEVESDEASSIVSVILSQKLEEQKIAILDHGTFLQLNLKNSIVPNPGEFFDGKGEYVKKIAIFQITPNDTAIRLFVAKDAGAVKKATNVDLLENRIVITVDHPVLLAELASLPSENSVLDGPSAEEVIAKTKIDREIPAPASSIKKAEVKEPELEFKNDAKLEEKLVALAAFSLIFLLGLTVFYTIRKKRGYLNRALDTSLKIRTVSIQSLGPKQNLTLVDVGGENILIGVSPNNINYIKTVGENKSSSQALPQPVRFVNQKQVVAEAPVIKKTNSPQNPNNVVVDSQTKVAGASSRPSSGLRVDYKTVGKSVSSTYGKNGKSNVERAGEHEAISDVTRIIRAKLKDLPML